MQSLTAQSTQAASLDRDTPALNVNGRLALTPTEFAATLGRSPTYGYRQLYAGKVNAITSGGRILIPLSEINRFLATAAPYTRKRKVAKKDQAGAPNAVI